MNKTHRFPRRRRRPLPRSCSEQFPQIDRRNVDSIINSRSPSCATVVLLGTLNSPTHIAFSRLDANGLESSPFASPKSRRSRRFPRRRDSADDGLVVVPPGVASRCRTRVRTSDGGMFGSPNFFDALRTFPRARPISALAKNSKYNMAVALSPPPLLLHHLHRHSASSPFVEIRNPHGYLVNASSIDVFTSDAIRTNDFERYAPGTSIAERSPRPTRARLRSSRGERGRRGNIETYIYALNGSLRTRSDRN